LPETTVLERPRVVRLATDRPPATQRTAVLFDAHPLWLDALEAVLARTGLRVVAKTGTPDDAAAAVEEHRPDLLVTEIAAGNGGLDGVGWLGRVLDRTPAAKAIVLSRHDEPELIDAALRAGAVAYVIKTAHADDLVSAVRQVFDHSVFLGSGSAGPQVADESAPGALRGLTAREREILRLLIDGHSNAQLAHMLWVTEQTVKFHLSNIYRKLGVANRSEASRVARLAGVGAGEPMVTRGS
jgi:DNA-binding NarL/FixJ family response regulator